MEVKWLAGNECYFGTVIKFIHGQNKIPAAVVKLNYPITVDETSGDTVILELRYEGSKWGRNGSVHVELCNFVPEDAPWKSRKQGKWVGSHASYVKIATLAGMTVNERLFHCGLTKAFDSAVLARQHSELVRILLAAEFSETQAKETAAAVLENPKLYGY
jgi:hypothetical protein